MDAQKLKGLQVRETKIKQEISDLKRAIKELDDQLRD
jgi:hypothetical protein